MEVVLPPETGLIVNQVRYRYTVEKNKDDDFTVTISNENLTGKEDRYWANKIVKLKYNYLYDPNLIAEHQYTENGNTWKGIG